MNKKLEQLAQRILPWAFGLFILCTILLIFVHEPWSDEAQAWMLARDSSVGHLLWYSAGYEGTPMLWHLILMPFAKLGFPYVTMQVVNAVLVIAASAVFVWKSPFSPLHRLLFLFGYFPLYEYNALSRSYVLSMLCLFLFAALYKYRVQRPVLTVLPLVFLLQTNTHSIPLAGMLLAYTAYDLFRFHRQSVRKLHVAALAVFAASFLFAIVQLITPPDLLSAIAVWDFSFTRRKLAWVCSVFAYICFPIPAFTQGFWDELNPLDIDTVMFILGPIGFSMIWVFLAAYRRMFFTYVVGALGLCSIFFFRIPPHTRHAGVLMCMFLVAIWISRLYETPHVPSAVVTRLRGWQDRLLVLFLLLHAVVGVNAVIGDVRYTFSAGKSLSQFVRTHEYSRENTILIAYPGSDAAAALPYMPDLFTTLYSVEAQANLSYTTWNNASFNEDFNTEMLNERMQAFAEMHPNTRLLFILGDATRSSVQVDPAHFTFVERFDHSVQPVNNYTLYEYHL